MARSLETALLSVVVASALLSGGLIPACVASRLERRDGTRAASVGRQLRGLQTGAYHVSRAAPQPPKLFTYTIRQQHYHDPDAFTQGERGSFPQRALCDTVRWDMRTTRFH
jgi:hypothetical protein